MPTESSSDKSDREHWFAGKDLDVLLFRVNRRLLPQATLFQDTEPQTAQPTEALAHILEVLTSRASSAESGRSYKRLRQVGNVERALDGSALTGRLGWARSGQTLSTVYDPETEEWVDREVTGDRSEVSPFAIIADGRYLGILRNSTFSEQTLAKVLTDLLNAGERDRTSPTTDFQVEPVGDSGEFFQRVDELDQLTRVEFVFRRPNPDAEDAFRELFERQQEYGADEIREVISTADDDKGLNKDALRSDQQSQGFIAAAMSAYGYLKARGRRRNRRVGFDQRRRVARVPIDNVSASWEAATEEVVEATREARRRRTADG